MKALDLCLLHYQLLLITYQKLTKKIFFVLYVFEIKNFGEHHDLYVQPDTLLLADEFENFRNGCIVIYKLDPVHFLSAPGLAWQACFKKKQR